TSRRRLYASQFFEPIHALSHHFGRDGETESLSGNALGCEGHFCRRDSHQPPGEIDDRAAAVAGINGRIGLYQVLVLDVVHGDRSFDGAEHSPADGAAVAHRIAHYNHRLAKKIWRDVVETDKWQRFFGVNFNESQVCLIIASDVARAVGLAVIGGHMNLQVRSAFDYMLVGHDVAGRVNNKTGPQALQRLADFARSDPVVTEKLRVKIFERIAHRAADDAFGVNV